MHSHAEELATAEAEASRLSTLAYDKEVELELAKERLDRIEDSDAFGTEKMAEAEREVERLEEEVREVSDELRSAADYLDLVERRAQGDYIEEDEDYEQ
jgi:hypothetical protein